MRSEGPGGSHRRLPTVDPVTFAPVPRNRSEWGLGPERPARLDERQVLEDDSELGPLLCGHRLRIGGQLLKLDGDTVALDHHPYPRRRVLRLSHASKGSDE